MASDGLNESTRNVLEIIRVYGSACPRDFALNDVWRYGARIFDLRKAGYEIEKVRCTRHHHSRVVWMYQEVGHPGRLN